METDAPVIPTYDNRNYTLIGSKWVGAFLSKAFGATSLNTIDVYVNLKATLPRGGRASRPPPLAAPLLVGQ
jgi:hypothetical protein